MDVAEQDNSINKDRQQLEAINTCRQYHGRVFPNNMTINDRRTMRRDYLWGRHCLRKCK